MDTPATRHLKLFGWLIYLFGIFYCLWLVGTAILSAQTTGVVSIKSTDSAASLIVGQDNHQAITAGTGNNKVRLPAGTYQISASDSNLFATGLVRVYKKQTSTISLNPTRPPTIPSVATVDFEGMNGLINSGLTTDQITALQLYLFKYKPSAKVVSVSQSSIYPEAHNPDTDTSFSIDFNVSIDAVPYKAIITYADLDNVQLRLYNTQGKLLFDSDAGN